MHGHRSKRRVASYDLRLRFFFINPNLSDEFHIAGKSELEIYSRVGAECLKISVKCQPCRLLSPPGFAWTQMYGVISMQVSMREWDKGQFVMTGSRTEANQFLSHFLFLGISHACNHHRIANPFLVP